MHRVLSGSLYGLVLAAQGLCLPVLAQGGETPAAPSAAPVETETVFEPTRRSVRSSTEWLARGVDSWFGDKPFSEGGKVSDGRLSVFLLTRQHEAPDLSVRFSARFLLPNVADRAYLFLGRDDSRETITDQPQALSRQQRLLRESNAETAFFAGLGIAPTESVQFRIGFHGGLKPYAHARYGHAWQLGGEDRIDVRETVFWALNDRFGSTTALSYEHDFSPTLLA